MDPRHLAALHLADRYTHGEVDTGIPAGLAGRCVAGRQGERRPRLESVSERLCIQSFDPGGFLFSQNCKLPFARALGKHAVVLV